MFLNLLSKYLKWNYKKRIKEDKMKHYVRLELDSRTVFFDSDNIVYIELRLTERNDNPEYSFFSINVILINDVHSIKNELISYKAYGKLHQQLFANDNILHINDSMFMNSSYSSDFVYYINKKYVSQVTLTTDTRCLINFIFNNNITETLGIQGNTYIRTQKSFKQIYEFIVSSFYSKSESENADKNDMNNIKGIYDVSL